MKHRIARSISLLLVFLMLLSVSAFAAQRNAASRHKACGSLSAQASAYYTGSFTFEKLCAMSSSALKDSLETLMTETITKTYSYQSLPGYWSRTDAAKGLDDALYFYSDVSCKEGAAFSREHVWPKSHGTFYESGAGSDLHHLRPEDNEVNTTRNNYTFGNVRGELWLYRTKSFAGKDVLWYNPDTTRNGCHGLVEVADNVKGDVARILLYVYTAYDQPNLYTDTASTGSGNEYSDGRRVIESLDTLLSWCESDPVDEWEMQRNDLVQELQGNRNVFIDYPELAWLLFDREIPKMETPSGFAKNHTGYLDVLSGAWYSAGVDYVTEQGLMEGVGRSLFRPNGSLTRAQLVMILYRMEGSPAVSGASPYIDVNGNLWYANAVIWASRNGIVKGYGGGIFRPNQPITREQLVTVLYRYDGGEANSTAALDPFPDGASVSGYARKAMSWAVEQKLLSGVRENGADWLMPGSGATRAQFAVMLMRWKK